MISSTHCDSLGDYQHYEIENRSKFYNYEIDDQNPLQNNLKFFRYGNAEHLDDANEFQNLFGSVICDQGKSNDLMRSFFSEVRCLEKRSPQHN